MKSRVPQIVSILLILSCLTALGATAAGEYTLTTTPSIDVPERTVTVEGETQTVSSVGRVMPGEELQINTGAPANANYDVYLYDEERTIVDAKSAEGNDSVSFATDYLDAGTYIAAIYGPNGDIQTVQPVVIAGYEVTLDTPRALTEGERLDVTVSLQQTSEAVELQGVEVVVTQDSSLVERTTATEQNGDYMATVDSLPEGEYRVYAVARNETIVRGQHELIGVSDPTRIQVETDDTNSAPAADQSSSNTGGSASDSTATQGASSTETATQTAAETSSTLLDETGTQTTSLTETDSTATADSDVLTVPSTATAQTTSTNSDGPWLTSLLFLVIALALVLPGRKP